MAIWPQVFAFLRPVSPTLTLSCCLGNSAGNWMPKWMFVSPADFASIQYIDEWCLNDVEMHGSTGRKHSSTEPHGRMNRTKDVNMEF